MQGMIPGSRGHGRSITTWFGSIMSWSRLGMGQLLQKTSDRKAQRQLVRSVTDPQIEAERHVRRPGYNAVGRQTSVLQQLHSNYIQRSVAWHLRRPVELLGRTGAAKVLRNMPFCIKLHNVYLKFCINM